MGSDPNIYPPVPPETSPDPHLALTIGEMAQRRWSIRSVCDRCCVVLWVDTHTLIAVVGPDAFFWARRGHCRAMIGISRCRGRTRFQAQTMRGVWCDLDEPIRTARQLWKVRALKARS